MNIPLIIVILYVVLLLGISLVVSKKSKESGEDFLLYKGKKEESCILDYVVSLPKNKFGVMEHSFLNRSEVAPMLIVIEKK